MSDYLKKGALDKKGFFIAFKLVAAAQQGIHPLVLRRVGSVTDGCQGIARSHVLQGILFLRRQ